MTTDNSARPMAATKQSFTTDNTDFTDKKTDVHESFFVSFCVFCGHSIASILATKNTKMHKNRILIGQRHLGDWLNVNSCCIIVLRGCDTHNSDACGLPLNEVPD